MSERGRAICGAAWRAGVAAVAPARLVHEAAANTLSLANAHRLLVVGGGKAGAAMLDGLPPELAAKAVGVINVPGERDELRGGVRLVAGRPPGSNHPTAAGVAGGRAMLDLVAGAQPGDHILCLLSGGGSALLPVPAESVSLADKQTVTAQLHKCGASIEAMNCVRKHLSAFKGGGLVRALPQGVPLDSWILSDVVGDPLDVIASGPTAIDPTTFADAWTVLEQFGLIDIVPESVRDHLQNGRAGAIPETLKALPSNVTNRVIGNNAVALAAAEAQAIADGFRVVNLGAYLTGDTRALAETIAAITRSILRDGHPARPPVMLLLGGETTVALPPDHGRGGRNQEFALACALALTPAERERVTILSAGTDGEDGPTDAAGAFADARTFSQGRDATDALLRHDAYPFFQATGDLLISGLTGTNVMDLRLVAIE